MWILPSQDNNGHVCSSIKSVQWFFLAYFFVSKQNSFLCNMNENTYIIFLIFGLEHRWQTLCGPSQGHFGEVILKKAVWGWSSQLYHTAVYHGTGKGTWIPWAVGKKMEDCQVHLPELEFVYDITASFGYIMLISVPQMVTVLHSRETAQVHYWMKRGRSSYQNTNTTSSRLHQALEHFAIAHGCLPSRFSDCTV